MKARRARSGERGIALIVALLVMVVLTVLGIPFLLMGETENRISENERLSLQALYAAEAGAQMVKRWFDNPTSSLNLVSLPAVGVVDRTLRELDPDGDGPTSETLQDGTAAFPRYKQSTDEIFGKPYRGSLEDLIMGTEAGPDMRIIETKSTATKTFLTDLSDALLPSYPSVNRRARIHQIDIYSPPYQLVGGVWERFGVATIKVVARIYQLNSDGTEDSIAERMVKIVINEIPYNPGDLGPLHSCEDLDWGGDFTVHWGVATAMNDAVIPSNHDKMAASFPRVLPGGNPTRIDLLWGHDDIPDKFNVLKQEIDGLRVEDPWLRFMSGEDLEFEGTTHTGGPSQPDPFDWVWDPPAPLGDTDFPSHEQPSEDGSHSNVFYGVPDVGCPVFDYDEWKSIAQGGGVNVHYYTWAPASLVDGGCDECFQENGAGTPTHFRDITDDRSGLFFFDTADRKRPALDINTGEFTNLTPAIQVGSTSTWGTRGMVYLNAFAFRVQGASGRPTVFKAPGEPFVDQDLDGRYDVGEPFLNLNYDCKQKGKNPCQIEDVEYYADLDDRMLADGTDGTAADPIIRNPHGPIVNSTSNVWGILYTNGHYDNTSNSRYYGTVIGFSGVGQQFASGGGGTPNHYWDESLRDNWPPDEWGLPRVAVSRWETDL